ncbi:MAG: beta-L-arabinofuranosidase domain-containing protein [Verrucomicrobiota bacterium]
MNFLICSLVLFSVSSQADVSRVEVATAPPDARPVYIGNRPPLAPTPFVKLPVGSITPKGWLRTQLELERDGMTGHLEEISKWCKFEGNAWVSPNGEGHSGWEELPYWLKGYGDLGYVLKDEKIIAEARKWIDGVLASQQEEGYFGPKANKTGLKGKPDLWPHMVMLNVLQSFYEYPHDERVIPFMLKYHRWLNSLPPEQFGLGYWPKIRFGDNIETAYWLYNRTGESFLLDLARKIHENMQDWTSGVHDWHNVNIAQAFREPAVYFQQAKELKFLNAAERNYQQVMGTYGQFPGGGFGGDENCRPGYTDPRQGFETCGIVEFMHSFEMLTKISGNPVWSDRVEELAFNSLPAAMSPDAKGLHYLTCANQVQLDQATQAPGIDNKGTMFSYSPGQVYRCCQHNVSHGWPYMSEELWLGTADRGLCVSLYSASEVKAMVGDQVPVSIREETDYPFSQTIRFEVSPEKSVEFPLYLRLPGWCARPSVKVNGKSTKFDAGKGYAIIRREWKKGDTVSLNLPMQFEVQRWEKNHNAASVNYGPITFALKIKERWEKAGGLANWPDYQVFPESAWNYALVLKKTPANSFHLVKNRSTSVTNPFTPATTPYVVEAEAKKIPEWKVDALGLVGTLQESPVKTDAPVEKVTLIPMGAARLRISSFPVAATGSEGHEWAAAK